jgi:hypothetical protein
MTLSPFSLHPSVAGSFAAALPIHYKCLGFRGTGKRTKPGADFERTLIYDRIVVRRDLSLGEVHWTQPSSDHAQQESDTNTNVITLVLVCLSA